MVYLDNVYFQPVPAFAVRVFAPVEYVERSGR